jgi:uncharacterized protein (DUF305 family)
MAIRITALGALLATGIAVAATPSLAQDHSSHDMGAMAADAASTPAAQGYKQAMDTMMSAMMETPATGDADVDFVQGMIPHHQAAIDMAKVVLEHGKDPDIRKLAEAIIGAQEAEIAEMRAWLKVRGK